MNPSGLGQRFFGALTDPARFELSNAGHHRATILSALVVRRYRYPVSRKRHLIF